MQRGLSRGRGRWETPRQEAVCEPGVSGCPRAEEWRILAPSTLPHCGRFVAQAKSILLVFSTTQSHIPTE